MINGQSCFAILEDSFFRRSAKTLQAARAVAVAFHFDIHAFHQAQPEVRHRRAVRELHVAARLEGTAAAAGKKAGATSVVMAGGVAVAVAKDDHGVVEQRLVTFFDRLHLLDEIGELLAGHHRAKRASRRQEGTDNSHS